MNICGTASTWSKVAIVLIVIGLALHIAGFATLYWMQQETIQENVVFSVGLWKANNCSGGHDSACNDMDVPSQYVSGSQKCVQAFECIVLVIAVVLAVVLGLYVASERFREISVAVFVCIVCFIAVTLGIIAMIVWLAQIPSLHYPGYSFGLAVVAYILFFLAGVLLIPDIRRYQQRRGDITKVRPENNRSEVRHVSKYDEYSSGQRHHDYSYNRKFAQTPETTMVRHYYNPNRVPYTGRTPPPKYQTVLSPGVISVGRNTRTDILTPDIYLGRDGPPLRRY